MGSTGLGADHRTCHGQRPRAGRSVGHGLRGIDWPDTQAKHTAQLGFAATLIWPLQNAATPMTEAVDGVYPWTDWNGPTTYGNASPYRGRVGVQARHNTNDTMAADAVSVTPGTDSFCFVMIKRVPAYFTSNLYLLYKWDVSTGFYFFRYGTTGGYAWTVSDGVSGNGPTVAASDAVGYAAMLFGVDRVAEKAYLAIKCGGRSVVETANIVGYGTLSNAGHLWVPGPGGNEIGPYVYLSYTVGAGARLYGRELETINKVWAG